MTVTETGFRPTFSGVREVANDARPHVGSRRWHSTLANGLNSGTATVQGTYVIPKGVLQVGSVVVVHASALIANGGTATAVYTVSMAAGVIFARSESATTATGSSAIGFTGHAVITSIDASTGTFMSYGFFTFGVDSGVAEDNCATFHDIQLGSSADMSGNVAVTWTTDLGGTVGTCTVYLNYFNVLVFAPSGNSVTI